MTLAGKVAIVTGASRGIGAGIATRLAAEGARLVLGFRSDTRAMQAVEMRCRDMGAEVCAVRGDLAEPQTAAALCDAALTRHGRVDVLVNNAGVSCEELLLLVDDAKLEQVVATNVMGLTRMTRAVVRPMLRQRSGAIINLSSVAAARPARGSAVYAGTKGYVESFTRALAVELGRKGIRVNAVAPGVVETAMTGPVLAAAREEVLARIPMRRIGSPQDVAAAVVFLASDEAAYLNGVVLPVDGGLVSGS